LVRQAVAAKEAGFDFVKLSDHFHPWLNVQGHSSFTWTVLGTLAARTERVGLATGVTCPTLRYHPAIIAQAKLSANRFAVTGWKVLSELPNPVNFEAATSTVREEDILGQFPCGPDPEVHLEGIRQFVDAGFDRLVLQNNGPDPDGFIDFWRRELEGPMREMATA
jgi:alkanesulfonate monooxygenase SsuD/methylene tetrahydromethanopterin reductase-like flavin-dependent oxidoreductase (luciferase family)